MMMMMTNSEVQDDESLECEWELATVGAVSASDYECLFSRLPAGLLSGKVVQLRDGTIVTSYNKSLFRWSADGRFINQIARVAYVIRGIAELSDDLIMIYCDRYDCLIWKKTTGVDEEVGSIPINPSSFVMLKKYSRAESLRLQSEVAVVLTGTWKGEVVVWRIELTRSTTNHDEKLKVTKCNTHRMHSEEVNCLYELEDGRVVSAGNPVKIWEVGHANRWRTLVINGGIEDYLFTPSERVAVTELRDQRLAVCSKLITRAVTIWDLVHYTRIFKWDVRASYMLELSDGSVLCASTKRTLQLWQLNENGASPAAKFKVSSKVSSMASLADGTVAIVGEGGKMEIVRVYKKRGKPTPVYHWLSFCITNYYHSIMTELLQELCCCTIAASPSIYKLSDLKGVLPPDLYEKVSWYHRTRSKRGVVE